MTTLIDRFNKYGNSAWWPPVLTRDERGWFISHVLVIERLASALVFASLHAHCRTRAIIGYQVGTTHRFCVTFLTIDDGERFFGVGLSDIDALFSAAEAAGVIGGET